MSAVTVADVMTREVVTVGGKAPFKDVVALLRDHAISAVPVLDSAGRGGVGGDLLVKERYRERAHAFGAIPLLVRSRLLRRAAATTAGEVMTTGVKTIGPDVTSRLAWAITGRATLGSGCLVSRTRASSTGAGARCSSLVIFSRASSSAPGNCPWRTT